MSGRAGEQAPGPATTREALARIPGSKPWYGSQASVEALTRISGKWQDPAVGTYEKQPRGAPGNSVIRHLNRPPSATLGEEIPTVKP